MGHQIISLTGAPTSLGPALTRSQHLEISRMLNFLTRASALLCVRAVCFICSKLHCIF